MERAWRRWARAALAIYAALALSVSAAGLVETDSLAALVRLYLIAFPFAAILIGVDRLLAVGRGGGAGQGGESGQGGGFGRALREAAASVARALVVSAPVSALFLGVAKAFAATLAATLAAAGGL